MCGPTVIDTDAALNIQARNLESVYVTESAQMDQDLNLDCSFFSTNKLCLSMGGRYTTSMQSAPNYFAGNIVLAYEVNDKVRVGAWADKTILNKTSENTNLGTGIPLVGLFGIWNTETGGGGYKFRLAAGYDQNDLTIDRSISGTSQAGSGKTTLHDEAISASVSRGFNLDQSREWQLNPLVGFRYSRLARDGYTESSSVSSPLTYSQLNDEAATAVASLRITDKISKDLRVVGIAGLEEDMTHNIGGISATGLTGGTATAYLTSNVRRTRTFGSLESLYNFDDTHRMSLGITYRQSDFNDANTTTAAVAYQIAF